MICSVTMAPILPPPLENFDDVPRKRNPAWVYMSPLAFAFLPLIRTQFRSNPVLQGRLVSTTC